MNPYRGDFDIELGGKSWTLRPDFSALCEIEECIQGPYMMIMNETRDGGMPRFKYIAAVIWAGIRGRLRDQQNGSVRGAPTFEEVGQMMQSDGLVNIAEKATKFMMYLLLDDKQVKEAEQESKSEEVEENPSEGVESPKE